MNDGKSWKGRILAVPYKYITPIVAGSQIDNNKINKRLKIGSAFVVRSM